MNKAELKKNVGHHVRLWPMAKRFVGGPGGLPLPSVDDYWSIDEFRKNGIRISNNETGHFTLLGFDQIREYITDPVHGQGYGQLMLKTQLNIGGSSLWAQPIARGGPHPDQFANVHGWNRANDAAYIRSLFPNPRPAPVMLQPGGGNLALAFVLFGLGIGIGALIADA